MHSSLLEPQRITEKGEGAPVRRHVRQMDRFLAACKWAANAAKWFVGTPRRAVLTMLVVVVAVITIATITSTPGFSAGVIFGLITAMILD